LIRLDRIILREIRLPLVDEFRSARGVVDHRRALLLELHDSDGVSTWSECVAESQPTYAPETVNTCWVVLEQFIVPLVIGCDFESATSLHLQLGRNVRGNQMSRAAIEMGAWAVDALKQKMPLASLLAQKCGVEPRTTVDAGIAIGMQQSPNVLADRCRSAVREGYRRIKIKIEPHSDVSFARAARDAIQSAAALTVDANCSYTLDDPALDELDEIGLSMIEQPLGPDDLLGHAALQSRLKTPLCLDESISGADRAREMIALESARILNLKPGRAGGFSESVAIHDACVRAAIPMWCGGMLETGIGRAYNVALASLPGFTLPGDLSPSSRYWKRDVITRPWMMENGTLRVPLDTAGTGVEADESFIDSITVRRKELSSR
jgi:O-succinylbenzoate synthase